MKTKLALLSVVLLCTVLLGGCGLLEQVIGGTSGDDSDTGTEAQGASTEKKKKSDSKLGDFNIHLGGEVKDQGNVFVIEGESNLLPGTRVNGKLLVNEDEVFADTTELIQEDGSFHMELEHHQFGEAEIVVRFDFESAQEDEILRHYGDKGQNLEGPFIYKHRAFGGDIMQKAQVAVAYTPDGESDTLPLQAPNWYDLPDDYGDPRVWIEVDEITEDGEFFYLHGRSNILEGAEIRGSYGPNRDETTVLPDGSFNLEIPYEYREDETFVIEFKPQFQWNTIEEAYGSEGQKLVGNLVVTNDYNNVQYIELEVAWDANE